MDMTQTMDALGHEMGVVMSTTMLRLVVALIVGGAIGLERQLRHKPAGLRTNMFICFGAAMFTVMSDQLAGGFGGDHTRVAAQIIPGIGFIGAGAILHGRNKVSGLTTAATLGVVTAIGIGVGAGAYVEAIGATVMVLGTLLALGWVERVVRRRLSNRRYTATVDAGSDAYARVERVLRDRKAEIRFDTIDKVGNDVEITFRVIGPQHEHEKLVKHMLGDENVRRFNRS